MSSFSLFSGLYSGLAYSKKWEHLDAALALHFAYYNFCRVHRTLRVTPEMEAGITDHGSHLVNGRNCEAGMSIDKLDSDGLRFGGLIRFALAFCIAAGLVYALVRLGLWHGVVNLN